MDEMTIKFIRSFIVLAGVPLVVYYAKDNSIGRVKYLILSLSGITIFAIGAKLAHEIDSNFFLIMALGWWLIYFAIALRLNDLGSSRWKALWAYIPVVLVVMFFYLSIKSKKIDNLEVSDEIRSTPQHLA
jgi:hypothetical protein